MSDVTCNLGCVNQPTTVYYHYPCVDGWVSALAAWLALGPSATYEGWPTTRDRAAGLAAQNDAWSLGPGSEERDPAVPGRLYYFLDHTPPTELLVSLLERGCSIVILDHHDSALRRLPELARLERSTGRLVARVSKERSGCWAAWEFFHPGAPVPQLVQYEDDRDRWQWALPDSRPISASIHTFPVPPVGDEVHFDMWTQLMQTLETEAGRGSVREAGEVHLLPQTAIVTRQLRRTRLGLVCGYEVPVVNVTAYHSETLHELLLRNPGAPFVAGYWDDHTARHWSLRSREDRGCDVSLIVETKGGGGHTLAAGFEEPLPPSAHGPVVLDDARERRSA